MQISFVSFWFYDVSMENWSILFGMSLWWQSLFQRWGLFRHHLWKSCWWLAGGHMFLTVSFSPAACSDSGLYSYHCVKQAFKTNHNSNSKTRFWKPWSLIPDIKGKVGYFLGNTISNLIIQMEMFSVINYEINFSNKHLPLKFKDVFPCHLNYAVNSMFKLAV